MAGPLFLALLNGGPRTGERITVAADSDGEPPEMIEVPDRAGMGPPAAVSAGAATARGASRYLLSGRDEHRSSNVYTHLPADR